MHKGTSTKRSSTTSRNSSANPSKETDGRSSMRMDPSRRPGQGAKGKEESMIPKPKVRSSSSDRLSGMRKSNLRTVGGAKSSIGQYTTASSLVSPMPSSRYTQSTRPSLIDQGIRGRVSNVNDQPSVVSKGYVTPMASGSRHVSTSDARNVRASSIERASALAPKVAKKDMRPLADKNYLHEMMNKVDNYFHFISQSTILNPNGNIKPLTLKIFIDATNLLVKLLDMKQSLSNANYIEEIPKIAKKLHYPGTMNKSWLKTANTPHSWPQAIGWISWLVELCEVKDLASDTFTLERLPIIGETEEIRENRRNMFFVMIKCYKAWNDEQPQEEERILEQYFQDEAERRGISTVKYDEIKAEYEKVQENLKKEQIESNKVNDEINELMQTLNNVKSDRAKQQEHVLDQQKYIEKTKKEIENMNKESEKMNKNIEQLEVTNKELNNAIKHQPMTVNERDELVKTCTEQQTYIQNFDVHLEEIKKEAYSLDMRLTTSNTNLVKTIFSYNQSIFMKLDSSKVNVEDLKMPENGICEADFMNRLEEKKSMMDEFIHGRMKELTKKKSKLESYRREKETIQTKRDALSEKMQKKKVAEEKKKQSIKVKENKKREEIKKWQGNIEELNELLLKASNELELLNQELADCTDKKEAVMRKKLHLQDSVNVFLEQLTIISDEHRSEIIATLESL